MIVVHYFHSDCHLLFPYLGEVFRRVLTVISLNLIMTCKLYFIVQSKRSVKDLGEGVEVMGCFISSFVYDFICSVF